MSQQQDHNNFKRYLQEVCKGNQEAASFCLSYAEMVCTLDDLIDKDKSWSKEHVVQAFVTYSNNLLTNPFVIKNAAGLMPLIFNGSLDFLHSELLTDTKEIDNLAVANVLKSSWHSVIYYVSALIGGQQHALDVVKKYRRFPNPADEYANVLCSSSNIADYYDKTTQMYLDSVGDHFQITGWAPSREESDKIQFDRMGVKNGDYLFDAGCGVLGPAISLLNLYPDCRIAATTLSPVQYKMGDEKIKEKRLSHKIHLLNKDYADTGLTAGTFDGIYFLESYCYSPESRAVAQECFRLLKPGGRVYIIGWFLPNRDLSTLEWIKIRQHEAEWHDHVQTVQDVVEAFDISGLGVTSLNQDVGKEFDFTLFSKANYHADGSVSDLAKFHKTTAWIDILKMAELKFQKRN